MGEAAPKEQSDGNSFDNLNGRGKLCNELTVEKELAKEVGGGFKESKGIPRRGH